METPSGASQVVAPNEPTASSNKPASSSATEERGTVPFSWLPPAPQHPYPPAQQQSQSSNGMSLRWKHARTLEVMQTYMQENVSVSQELCDTSKQLKDARDQLQDEKMRNEILSEKVKRMEGEATGQRREVENMQKELHEARTSAVFARQVAELTNQLNKVKLEREEARDQADVLEVRLYEQRRTHDSLKQQRDEAEVRATELETACKRMTSEGDEKAMLIEGLERDLAAAQGALKAAEEEREQLTRASLHEVGSNARLNDTLTQSAEQIGALQEDLRAACEARDTVSEAASRALAEAQGEVFVLRAQLAEAQMLAEEVRRRCDRAEEQGAAEREGWQDRVEELQEHVKELTAQLRGRSHFAEFVDIKMEKKQLENEVGKLKVSQEKLLRALASEKQVARRLSSGGSVCSASSSLFNTSTLPTPTPTPLLSPSPFCASASLSSSSASSFSVLRDANNKTILLPPRHHGRASSLCVSLAPTGNGRRNGSSSAGSGETGEAVQHPPHTYTHSHTHSHTHNDGRHVDTPASGLSSDLDLGDDNLFLSDAFGQPPDKDRNRGGGRGGEGPIREKDDDDVSEVSFATSAAAVCPLSASRRRASLRVSR